MSIARISPVPVVTPPSAVLREYHATFRTSGTWTVPIGVTSIAVIVVGAGGYSTSGTQYGGGGAGRVIEVRNLAVTPGVVLTCTVGTGAAISDSSLSGSGITTITATAGASAAIQSGATTAAVPKPPPGVGAYGGGMGGYAGSGQDGVIHISWYA